MKLVIIFCITLTPIKHFPHHRDANLMKIMGITQNFGQKFALLSLKIMLQKIFFKTCFIFFMQKKTFLFLLL